MRENFDLRASGTFRSVGQFLPLRSRERDFGTYRMGLADTG